MIFNLTFLFERYVNSKDNQTRRLNAGGLDLFERYVNSKDNQTVKSGLHREVLFERYVNSKDNQTADDDHEQDIGLRDM